jgi:hypothetical protein
MMHFPNVPVLTSLPPISRGSSSFELESSASLALSSSFSRLPGA